ncbi:MAG: HD domain-containing protein [bacterium]
MKETYKKMWKLAKPHYQKGRPMDIDHIEWMMKDALLVCKKEKIDDSLLLPLVILHDVGYSKTPKGNPFRLDLKKTHMKAGAEIAKEILQKLDYPDDKIEKIFYYVSVHDKWIFGEDDLFKKDIILGVFNDLDFMWMATPKGFPALMKILKKNPGEMIEYLEKNEKIKRRPFLSRTTKKLYDNYLKDRRREQKI